jgi:hypothetical protein
MGWSDPERITQATSGMNRPIAPAFIKQQRRPYAIRSRVTKGEYDLGNGAFRAPRGDGSKGSEHHGERPLNWKTLQGIEP